jgi:hypothetical protein
MKKPRVTALQRKLSSLQSRIDRTKELADFLTRHPHLAEVSDLKATSSGLMGLVVDDRVFIRPLGLKKPGLRMEKSLEDSFTEVELEDRTVSEDVSKLTSGQLDDLLATVPNPNSEEDEEE